MTNDATPTAAEAQPADESVTDEREEQSWKTRAWQHESAARASKDRAEALQAELGAANARVVDLERADLAGRIGREYNLPDEVSRRLQGDDEDAIRADAEAVATAIESRRVKRPSTDSGPRGSEADGTPHPMSNDPMRAALTRR